jgi:shikimate dehydrogenase
MKKACVIGWPISHSRSPLIHGHWLTQYGIAGSYERVPVKPEELPSFVERIRRGELAGSNVTVPHKEAVLQLVDEADGVARDIGAANTLWRDGGRVLASNTDAYGFICNLNAHHPQWRDAPGIPQVIGAGGSARAVLFALKQAGCRRIRLVNRTRERAEQLAAHFGAGIDLVTWEERALELRDISLLVNTTTQGMASNPPLDLALEGLPAAAIVYDLIYVPLVTPLLAAARARGFATVGGLGMLLHQAVPGFERWFGRRPEVTETLLRLVEADIAGAH